MVTHEMNKISNISHKYDTSISAKVVTNAYMSLRHPTYQFWGVELP
jgi:hypothetical protein